MTAELERENAELLQFLYACPIGLVALDGTGLMTMLNPLAMQLILPLARRHEVTNLFTILEPYAPELRALIAEFAPKQGTVCENLRIFVGLRQAPSTGKAVDGRTDLVLACTLVKLAADRFMVTLANVSLQVHQERRLKQAEAWFSSMIDGIEDFAALSLDARGFIDHVNSSVARQTGFAEDELIGRGLDHFDAPDPASSVLSAREQIALATRDGWHLDEGWCAQKDGTRRWCQRLISVCREDGDDEGRTISGFTVVMRAVTRQGADAGTLKRRLTTDHLTGVANRAHFFDVAERQTQHCRRTGQSAAVIVLDIDHFKQVNDRFGHALGDEVLKAVGTTCKAALRPSDTLARLGGEEFVVLLPAADLERACETAERLRIAVAALQIDTPLGVIGVTASFGCATLDGGGLDLAAVLASADAALYVAKRDGRNRVAVDSDRNVAA